MQARMRNPVMVIPDAMQALSSPLQKGWLTRKGRPALENARDGPSSHTRPNQRVQRVIQHAPSRPQKDR